VSQGFPVRALEIHDSFSIWNLDRIRRALSFMRRNGMNSLILHENEIVDKVVYPGLLYGAGDGSTNTYDIHRRVHRVIYDRKPSPFVFIAEKLIFRDLLRIIIHEGSRAGIRVYLQNKELWFPETVYGSKLVKDGAVCPCEPYWWEEYLPAKYRELADNFPELAGVVTSTATRESKASPALGRCGCERCRAMRLPEWQRLVTTAIHGPLHRAGMELVVRDFTYAADEQDRLAEGIIGLPADVAVSIKNTPQDYYPTYDHNPLLGKVGRHPQWIEYDVMGEYYGFGVAPCILLDDIKDRMRHDLERGGVGFTARVDWEALPNHSCFETANLLNLYGAALLGRDPDMDLAEIYDRWLSEEHLLQPGLQPERRAECRGLIRDVLGRTWPVIEKSLYIGGVVVNENSKIPVSVENADYLSQELHGFRKWYPDRLDIPAMARNDLAAVLREKDRALEEARALRSVLPASNPGFDPSFFDRLAAQLDFLEQYVRMWRSVGRTYVLLARLEDRTAAIVDSRGDLVREAASVELRELAELEREIERYRFFVGDYPARLLLSAERVRCFREDAERVLASVEP
jgi:hypothetical protein